MTKLKSKKMSKQTVAIIIMAVIMVAMLAFGGTFAYFTATATEKTSGEITTGYVRLESDATFVASTTHVIPGTTIIDGPVTVTPSQDGTGSYIALRFIVEIKKQGEDAFTVATDDNAFNFDEVVAKGWFRDTTNNMFIRGSAANTYTEVSAADPIQFTTGDLIFDIDDNWIEDQGQSELNYMNATIKVTIRAASIQSSDGQDGKVPGETVTTELKALLDKGTYPDIIA